jgi:hypothetical protein
MGLVHVYPLDDLREHVTSGPNCWCRPRIDEEENGAVVIHNSMDRREEYEEGRKPN